MSGTHDGQAFDYTDPGAVEAVRGRERVILVGVWVSVLEDYARDNGIAADSYTIVIRIADVRRLAERDRTYLVVDRGVTAEEDRHVSNLVSLLEGAGKVAKR